MTEIPAAPRSDVAILLALEIAAGDYFMDSKIITRFP